MLLLLRATTTHLDGDSALMLGQQHKQLTRPVAVVAHSPKVRQWPLRCPHLAALGDHTVMLRVFMVLLTKKLGVPRS